MNCDFNHQYCRQHGGEHCQSASHCPSHEQAPYYDSRHTVPHHINHPLPHPQHMPVWREQQGISYKQISYVEANSGYPTSRYDPYQQRACNEDPRWASSWPNNLPASSNCRHQVMQPAVLYCAHGCDTQNLVAASNNQHADSLVNSNYHYNPFLEGLSSGHCYCQSQPPQCRQNNVNVVPRHQCHPYSIAPPAVVYPSRLAACLPPPFNSKPDCRNASTSAEIVAHPSVRVNQPCLAIKQQNKSVTGENQKLMRIDVPNSADKSPLKLPSSESKQTGPLQSASLITFSDDEGDDVVIVDDNLMQQQPSLKTQPVRSTTLKATLNDRPSTSALSPILEKPEIAAVKKPDVLLVKPEMMEVALKIRYSPLVLAYMRGESNPEHPSSRRRLYIMATEETVDYITQIMPVEIKHFVKSGNKAGIKRAIVKKWQNRGDMPEFFKALLLVFPKSPVWDKLTLPSCQQYKSFLAGCNTLKWRRDRQICGVKLSALDGEGSAI